MKPVDKNDNCAQITIDYIAGMGIFLIAVAFVFQFIYGLFLPFQSSSDEVTLAADRASIVIVERMLVPDRYENSNVIDEGKLAYLNNTKLNSKLNPQNYIDTLREVGLLSKETYTFDMNISVVKLDGTTRNQSGPSIPEKANIGQTRRLVMIVNSSTGYNETVTLSVRVW
jgi:hypothetical protein